ncbi:hypothetical protein SDRG_05232 [Saprolegnia diclina VS20]|uniref:Uncharacterized protein n=1 Tax=Saprolegnia diclina (strain VS20) TaxID=1156394 RepID=T0QUE9_SAPDV|nr:hypothetical protein SDRG_05232 [Saprolegnia diclina VS20]EQC37640.1 hypothetical protein SDRG_05232 [Saprolegnia diclina VS20]|eukprot:XP_008609160.1 hypothetical protein SDRG_05232 [Saprolegnia diclina VS20]
MLSCLLFCWTLALLLHPLDAATTNTSTLTLGACNDAGCLDDNTTTGVILLNATSTTVNASRLHIDRVTSLPPNVTSLDLSQNALSSLAVDAYTSLTFLNLSRNAFQSTSALSLPTSLRILDLSENNVSYLDATTWDWQRYPSLSKLILRSNNLVRLECNQFPASITEIDLSGNPLVSFTMDQATYTDLLARPVIMRVDNTAGIVKNCRGSALQLHGTVVCVGSRSTASTSRASQGYVLQYLLIMLAVTIALLVVVQYRKRRARTDANDDPELLRATCTSSILYEHDPLQLVTPWLPHEKDACSDDDRSHDGSRV